jgi:hypothetical protein
MGMNKRKTLKGGENKKITQKAAYYNVQVQEQLQFGAHLQTPKAFLLQIKP